MKVISVVIPVYFNEGSLPVLHQELQEVEQKLSELDLSLQLIFVDDGSGDHSFAELIKIKTARPETKVIKLTRNFGGVHAVKIGFQHVTGDAFMMLAADCQDPPAMILEMAKHWLAGEKYVVCRRAARHDPWMKRFFAYLYYILVRKLVVKDYPDGGYDLALLDRVMLSYLQQSAKHINTTMFVFWLGFKPKVLSYERRERVHGKSRWTFSKNVKFMLDTMLGFSIVPIRFISLVGVAVSLLSFIYGILVIVAAMRGDSQLIRGWPSMAAITSFLLGLIIMTLGIIGEYVWRIFDEVSRRPEAVIEEIH